MTASKAPFRYGETPLAVHLYSVAMLHLILASALASAPSPPASDPISARHIYLLGGITFGLVIFLLIILLVTAIRRNSARRFSQPRSEPDANPLCRTDVDPWQESARRLQDASGEDD